MNVGDISIESIIDGVGVAPATEVYASLGERGSSEADWAPHLEFLADDGVLELTVGSFLIRSGDRVVLVDLGLNVWPEGLQSRLFQWTTGALLSNLSAQGVSPEEITDVVFTHLHFDHVGWASIEGRPVFPEATFRCDERDFEHFFPKGADAIDPRVEERLAPVGERWELWDSDTSILPGINALSTPGHTPGSTTIVISSGEERALLLGDVVHCPVELVDDEWGMMKEVDPELAKRSRAAMVRELEGGTVPAAAAHFPGMQFGRLLSAQGKRRWVV